jgi:hypothetical protein
MAQKLTVKQLDARYEALSEASRHLQADWTSSAVEHAEGLVMSAWLQDQAEKWLARSETCRLSTTVTK